MIIFCRILSFNHGPHPHILTPISIISYGLLHLCRNPNLLPVSDLLKLPLSIFSGSFDIYRVIPTKTTTESSVLFIPFRPWRVSNEFISAGLTTIFPPVIFVRLLRSLPFLLVVWPQTLFPVGTIFHRLLNRRNISMGSQTTFQFELLLFDLIDGLFLKYVISPTHQVNRRVSLETLVCLLIFCLKH